MTIIGYKISKGRTHNSKREESGDFKAGRESATSFKNLYSNLVLSKAKKWVTVRHIIHNRMRHNRPHTDSYIEDQAILRKEWHVARILKEELSQYFSDEKIEKIFGGAL